MPVQAPQWTDFLSCLICYNEFECTIRRPVSLGCGHTMCKSCLLKLQRKQCPFDQTVISVDINQLPENTALLQLVGGRAPEKVPPIIPLVPKEDYKHYLEAKKCVEELALYLKSPPQSLVNGVVQNSPLSRPMQRKLVTLINCQLVEEEGRSRGMRAARSLGERSVTELILQHQNPTQLSANLWASVRARGCQFLGPAMQEEVLKLVLLALEDGSALSRKVLVMFVVQRLAPHFPQASKTSISHVVQLLYRASCFKVSKRDGDSSLMQLKEEFRTYETLRREHDAQIVQLSTEAGLRIAPEQWSSLLYGDTAHKSHMQSIIDKLQTPQSFSQSVQELIIALTRTGDPGNLSVLRPYLELLASIDPSPDASPPTWEDLKNSQDAARIVVKGLVDFLQNFGNRKLQETRLNLNAKYKTSMCRDFIERRNCPRGLNCTFAHSQEELEKFRSKSKRSGGSRSSGSMATNSNPENSCGMKDEDLLLHNSCSLNSGFGSDGSSSSTLNLLGDDASLSPSASLQAVSHVVNAAICKPTSKTSQFECQTLAALQQRKKHLMAQLDQFPLNAGITTSENGTCSSSIEKSQYCVLKTMDDGNVVSFYSPWTSASVFPYGSSTHCTNSDYTIGLHPSSNKANCDVDEEKTNGLTEADFTNSGLFCPSEKDEFIPFDPPLASKYGPISPFSKNLIRSSAPIQVNAVSQRGELTNPTSAVRHPLPSASLAPSFYPSHSPIHLPIIQGQYLPIIESGSVVVPVAMDCALCQPQETEMIRSHGSDVIKGLRISGENLAESFSDLSMDGLLQVTELKELNRQALKEELFEIEKTIQMKHNTIVKDHARYIESPFRQKCDLKASGTVPTSIGPWPTETLENTHFKSSETMLMTLDEIHHEDRNTDQFMLNLPNCVDDP